MTSSQRHEKDPNSGPQCHRNALGRPWRSPGTPGGHPVSLGCSTPSPFRKVSRPVSRYHFRVGNVSVQTGWDVPLQHFFLRVSNGKKSLYDNLADSSLSWGEMTLVQVREALDRLGIPTPPDLFARLESDMASPGANNIHDLGVIEDRST